MILIYTITILLYIFLKKKSTFFIRWRYKKLIFIFRIKHIKIIKTILIIFFRFVNIIRITVFLFNMQHKVRQINGSSRIAAGWGSEVGGRGSGIRHFHLSSGVFISPPPPKKTVKTKNDATGQRPQPAQPFLLL